MLSFISNNIGTIVVAIIVFVILAIVLIKMIRDKKAGKNSCSCGCEGCPSASICHKR